MCHLDISQLAADLDLRWKAILFGSYLVRFGVNQPFSPRFCLTVTTSTEASANQAATEKVTRY